MKAEDVHNRIRELSKERGLSSYELARRSGMALSSLYNMFERETMPKLGTLERICSGMDVTLSDFFAFLSKPRIGGYMSENDAILLEKNRELSEKNQEHLIAYAHGMLAAQGDADQQ